MPDEIILQSILNMEEFGITEKDLPLDLKKRLSGLKSGVGRYNKKPSEGQRKFVLTTDAILAHDIQDFAEDSLPEEDITNQIINPMPEEPPVPPTPPVEPPAPPVEPPAPPVEPPAPPVEPPAPPAPPVEPPAPPTPPVEPPAKKGPTEYLDYFTGG